MRRKSWEVRTCECSSRRVALSFLFNKFGVKPERPWHTPISTMAGAEGVIRPGLNLSELWNAAQRPAMVPLQRAMGGRPHGVVMTSVFWDLSYPDISGIRTNHSDLWLEEWKTNATELMRIVKSEFSVDVTSTSLSSSSKQPFKMPWFGWRLANEFIPVKMNLVVGFWNSDHALSLLHKMNNIMVNHAPTQGYQIVDTMIRMDKKGKDRIKYLRD